jgi:hypothetical protein
LGSPRLGQTVSCQLPVAKVLEDFPLLLRFAEDFKLAAAQILQLCELILQCGNSPDARSVGGLFKLKLYCRHASAEIRRELFQSAGSILLCPFPLLPGIDHLADDDLEP